MVLIEDIVGKEIQEQITTTLNEQSFPLSNPTLDWVVTRIMTYLSFPRIFEDEEMKGTSFLSIDTNVTLVEPNKSQTNNSDFRWGNLIFVFWICWSKIIGK